MPALSPFPHAASAPICRTMEFPAQPWPTGQVEQLEPLVARLLAANPGPFTFTGTQSYIVGNAAGVVVIDPGPDEPDQIAALLSAIGNAPLLAIACTHTHRDHSPAAAPLAAHTGAPIIGCAALTLDDAGPRADAAFDPDYAPTHTLADGARIAGDDWALVAVATPGHTSNHLCYALEVGGVDGGALFTGDHVMGWSTTVVAPPDGDMAAYMASLDKLRHRATRVYYPAHGPAITRPAQLLRGMIGHRRQRERQILGLVASGTASIADMVPRMYKGVNPVLWPAAGRSVLAHLIDLETRSAVIREGELWRAVMG